MTVVFQYESGSGWSRKDPELFVSVPDPSLYDGFVLS